MEEIARAYETQAGNTVIVLIKESLALIGLSIPNQDRTRFREDIKRLKNGDIPLTAYTISPHDCYNFCRENDPYVILYDNDTISGKGAGDSYYDG